ncbi:MAG: hypothetical protein AAFZ15_23210 [Bacteroidota bacterium]
MTEEQQIQKGFNAGYLIAKHRPDLAEKMQNGFVDKGIPYALGFIAGTKEHKKEVSKIHTRNYTPNHLPKSSNDPKKEKDRDRDFRDIK